MFCKYLFDALYMFLPTGISCFLMVHSKACLDIGFHIQGGIFSDFITIAEDFFFEIWKVRNWGLGFLYIFLKWVG